MIKNLLFETRNQFLFFDMQKNNILLPIAAKVCKNATGGCPHMTGSPPNQQSVLCETRFAQTFSKRDCCLCVDPISSAKAWNKPLGIGSWELVYEYASRLACLFFVKPSPPSPKNTCRNLELKEMNMRASLKTWNTHAFCVRRSLKKRSARYI